MSIIEALGFLLIIGTIGGLVGGSVARFSMRRYFAKERGMSYREYRDMMKRSGNW